MNDLSFGYGMPLYNAFLYHFQHANIFHLAGNLLVLYQLRQIWLKGKCSTIINFTIAYFCASIAALCPLTWKELPTCGLSAVIFALVAQANAKNKQLNMKLIAINSLLAFIPAYNWRIHLAAYLLAYTIWRVLYGTPLYNKNN